jgi:hypothetical protein
MNGRQTLTVAAMLLLAVAFPSYGEDMATILSRASAAKAAAGREVQLQGRLDLPVAASIGTFTTFDYPGAGIATPCCINRVGDIAGYYYDANGVHGFLRKADGSFISFDVPGAVVGLTYAMNESGEIAGPYPDANNAIHGFLRNRDGSISTFDVPGAGSGPLQGTWPLAIDREGAITGFYVDANGADHGFLRAPSGTLTKINVAGAAQGFGGEGTFPAEVNSAGAVLGTYVDAIEHENHGFLRTAGGRLIRFDTPPPSYIGYGWGPYAYFYGTHLYFGPSGTMIGTYFEFIPGNPFGGNYRVFIRSSGDLYLTFDAATYGPCCLWSVPSGVTPGGVIAGYFNDGYGIFHGFVRAFDGTIATFDAPGAGTGNFQGTVTMGINPSGFMAGYLVDTNSTNHGFLLSP